MPESRVSDSTISGKFAAVHQIFGASLNGKGRVLGCSCSTWAGGKDLHFGPVLDVFKALHGFVDPPDGMMRLRTVWLSP